MRISRLRLRAALPTAVFGFLLVAPLMQPCTLRAQAAPAAQSAPAQSGGDSNTFIDKKTASSQNLAKAEQEDEEYAFKHSASVRAFARIFHLSPETASMVFWAFNALLLIAFVGYFLRKALPAAFRNRRQRLEQQIVEARTATEQANERLKAVEDRLSRLDSEIAAVREQAERESAQDEVRLRATIEEERQKIVASAEQEITAAGAAAERQLRRFAAGLAVDRATARLNLTEGDDRALIQDFASSLGTGHDDGRGGRN